jgi:hypothetical protein
MFLDGAGKDFLGRAQKPQIMKEKATKLDFIKTKKLIFKGLF